MSWSVSAIGRAPAVAASIEKQFQSQAQYPCQEPEESIKQSSRQVLAQALAAQKPEMVVRVNAAGSMSSTNDSFDPKRAVVISNSLSVAVEVLYGFIE